MPVDVLCHGTRSWRSTCAQVRLRSEARVFHLSSSLFRRLPSRSRSHLPSGQPIFLLPRFLRRPSFAARRSSPQQRRERRNSEREGKNKETRGSCPRRNHQTREGKPASFADPGRLGVAGPLQMASPELGTLCQSSHHKRSGFCLPGGELCFLPQIFCSAFVSFSSKLHPASRINGLLKKQGAGRGSPFQPRVGASPSFSALTLAPCWTLPFNPSQERSLSSEDQISSFSLLVGPSRTAARGPLDARPAPAEILRETARQSAFWTRPTTKTSRKQKKTGLQGQRIATPSFCTRHFTQSLCRSRGWGGSCFASAGRNLHFGAPLTTPVLLEHLGVFSPRLALSLSDGCALRQAEFCAWCGSNSFDACVSFVVVSSLSGSSVSLQPRARTAPRLFVSSPPSLSAVLTSSLPVVLVVSVFFVVLSLLFLFLAISYLFLGVC